MTFRSEYSGPGEEDGPWAEGWEGRSAETGALIDARHYEGERWMPPAIWEAYEQWLG